MYTKISKPSSNEAPISEAARAALGRATGGAMASVIRKDIRVTGDVVCSGDVQLDGIVEGNIESRGATISEGAQVHGSISAESVRVMGAVTGQIRGQSVTLAKTARVVGDIWHQTLAIEPGAFLDGQCRPLNPAENGEGDDKADPKFAQVREKAAAGQASSGPSNGQGAQATRLQR